MSKEIDDLIESVRDEQSFLEFVKALYIDRQIELEKEKIDPSSPYSSGADGWENGTIEDFLESAHAWALDTNFGANQELEEALPWRRFAQFLYAGKFYE